MPYKSSQNFSSFREPIEKIKIKVVCMVQFSVKVLGMNQRLLKSFLLAAVYLSQKPQERNTQPFQKSLGWTQLNNLQKRPLFIHLYICNTVFLLLLGYTFTTLLEWMKNWRDQCLTDIICSTYIYFSWSFENLLLLHTKVLFSGEVIIKFNR